TDAQFIEALLAMPPDQALAALRDRVIALDDDGWRRFHGTIRGAIAVQQQVVQQRAAALGVPLEFPFGDLEAQLSAQSAMGSLAFDPMYQAASLRLQMFEAMSMMSDQIHDQADAIRSMSVRDLRGVDAPADVARRPEGDASTVEADA